jgi:DNA-binding XRE family transcriptional regulator
MELATLKDLRIAAKQTQEDLAAALGVGQDTISRLERRSDMLLSTLRHYVESMGGKLELVAQFPDRPPVVIEHLGIEEDAASAHGRNTFQIRRLAGCCLSPPDLSTLIAPPAKTEPNAACAIEFVDDCHQIQARLFHAT